MPPLKGIRAAVLMALVATAASGIVGAPAARAEPADPAVGLPPHVPTEIATPVCAMCHRGHTGASDTTWWGFGADQKQNSALLVGSPGDGDTGLCYTCHGIDALGSGDDVQSAFEATSGHTLVPESPKRGRPKQCSSCHDSHGSAREAPGVPYSALLRSVDDSGTLVYEGDVYCATCHPDRPEDTFDGLAIWRKTAHAGIAPPSSGTEIVCSSCHEPHGSTVAPSLRSVLATPAVPSPVTVPVAGREWCYGCHAEPLRAWEGTGTYASSSHGSSEATVPISGEWAEEGAARRVGECGSCHAPMGSKDAAGALVPRLLETGGRTLCDRCHRAAGPARTDMASLAHRDETAVVELVAGLSATTETASYGRIQVYTRESTSADGLIGPREYLEGPVGAVATGDIDRSGADEVVVHRSGGTTVTVLSASPVFGLTEDPGDRALLGPADFMAIGNVIGVTDDTPELIAVDRTARVLRTYRWNGVMFVLVDALGLPSEPTGLAVGDLRGTSLAEVAVTLASDELALISASGATLQLDGVYPTLSEPVSPSIGEVWDVGSTHEVVVANRGQSSGVFSVFSETGARLFDIGTTADASPTVTLVADVLPDVEGDEIVGALSDPAGPARIEIYAQAAGPSFAPPVGYALGDGDDPTALAAGDLDSDADLELAVVGAGRFARDASRRQPSISVFDPTANGATLELTRTLTPGGAELAGGRPTLAIAQLGPIGLSRHPVGAFGSHSSTETATLSVHVECADCHNSHAANEQTATAPLSDGVLAGVPGVSVTNDSEEQVTLTGIASASREYEVCLKCHSAWSGLGSVRSIASEVNTRAASFHPVESAAPTTNADAGTFTGGFGPGSYVRCTDCHGNSRADVEVSGPHRSAASPLLLRPATGISPVDADALCYRCHRVGVYGTGDADGDPGTTSGFRDGDAGLHSRHVLDLGLGCASCHESHGSRDLPWLLRDDVGWTAGAYDGGCENACHDGGALRTYTR